MQTVSFATAPRPCPEALTVARKMLNKGYGFQNAARIAGMNETTLRGLLAAPKPRVSKPVTAAPHRVPEPGPRVCNTVTEDVILRVATKYGLTPADFAGDRRHRYLSFARHEAMYEVKAARPHLSLPAIARIFGGKDHTSVLHALRTHAARLAWGDVLTHFATVEQPDLFAGQTMKAAA